MVKIVLDTNLLIAARWNKISQSNAILDMCISGLLQAGYTSEVKKENLHILSKVRAPKDYMFKILKFYETATQVTSTKKISASIDDADNRFLEAAKAFDADYLISNDHHLLDLKEYCGIKILKPSDFTKIIV